MSKAIPIGNGFTLNLISAFKDEEILRTLSSLEPDLIDRANEAFEAFRDLNQAMAGIRDVVQSHPQKSLMLVITEQNPLGLTGKSNATVSAKILNTLVRLGFSSPRRCFSTILCRLRLALLSQPKDLGRLGVLPEGC